MKKILSLSIAAILATAISASSSLARTQFQIAPSSNLNKGSISEAKNLPELDDFMAYIKREVPKTDGREVIGEGVATIRGKNVNEKTQGVKIPIEVGYTYTFASVNYGSDTHEVTIVRGSDNAILIAGIKDGIVASSDRVNEEIFYSNINFSTQQKADTIYFIPKGAGSRQIRWVLMRKKV